MSWKPELSFVETGNSSYTIKQLPQLDIPLNDGYFDGFISSITDWDNVYLIRDPSILHAIHLGIGYQSNSLSNAVSGQLAVAKLKYHGEEVWRRVIVTGRTDGTHDNVFLVDTGAMQRVQTKNIFNMPDEVKTYPPQAFHVQITSMGDDLAVDDYEILRTAKVTAKLVQAGSESFVCSEMTLFSSTSSDAILLPDVLKNHNSIIRYDQESGINYAKLTSTTTATIRKTTTSGPPTSDGNATIIILCVLGGCLVIAGICAFVYWWRRRYKRRKYSPNKNIENAAPSRQQTIPYNTDMGDYDATENKSSFDNASLQQSTMTPVRQSAEVVPEESLKMSDEGIAILAMTMGRALAAHDKRISQQSTATRRTTEFPATSEKTNTIASIRQGAGVSPISPTPHSSTIYSTTPLSHPSFLTSSSFPSSTTRPNRHTPSNISRYSNPIGYRTTSTVGPQYIDSDDCSEFRPPTLREVNNILKSRSKPRDVKDRKESRREKKNEEKENEESTRTVYSTARQTAKRLEEWERNKMDITTRPKETTRPISTLPRRPELDDSEETMDSYMSAASEPPCSTPKRRAQVLNLLFTA